MRTVLLVGLAALALGCGGHSEEEWERAQGDVAKLKADLDAANERHGDDERKAAAAQEQIDDLKAKLTGLAAGVATQVTPLRAVAEPPPPTPSVHTGWIQINRIAVTKKPGCIATTYVAFEGVDAQRAAQGARQRTAFSKTDLDDKKHCGSAISSAVSRDMFDCDRRTTMALDGYNVDWSGVRSDYQGDGSVVTVFPDDTIGDLEWKYVCGVPR